MVNLNAVTLEDCIILWDTKKITTVLHNGKIKRFEKPEEPKETAFYEGIGKEDGLIVEKEDAFQYALERCLHGTEEEKAEFKEMLEEWYFSGNWILREGK